MTKRHVPLLAVLLVAMLAAPAAAQAPRAAPPNDNFIDATPMVIGKDYKVPDIDLATNEPGEPSPGCGIVHNSVWYTFSTDRATIALFSTAGSIFNHPLHPSVDTRLAIFTGSSLGTLSMAGCSDNLHTLHADFVFDVDPGVVYYLAVGTSGLEQWTAGSKLAIQTRALQVIVPPDNDGFENPLAGNWKVKNPNGAAPVCNNSSYPSAGSFCAFKFTGGSGIKHVLSQTVPVDTFVPRKNGAFRIGGAFRVMDASIATAKAKFTLNYSDGTPATRVTLNLGGTGPMGAYDGFLIIVAPASKNVASVTYKVEFKSAAGVLLVDVTSIIYTAGLLARSQHVLPLPAAPEY